ncbi:MHYT domain-containing protein [Pseudomonas citronellolis]|uniref:MHYT domain-containing protein n=1 Tax=Pseudomonas citronellolis TaxID=53408 RepID=UPI003B0061AE
MFAKGVPRGVDLLSLGVVADERQTRRRPGREMHLVEGTGAWGCGIAGMRYLGMYAMLMQPGIDYDPLSFGLPLVVAGRAGQRLAGAAGDPRDPGHPRHRAVHLRARRLPGGAHSSRSCSHRLRPALGQAERA